MKVAPVLSWEILPVTGTPPKLRVNVSAVMVPGFMALLKVAAMEGFVRETPVAPLAGDVERTVGDTEALVVKLHVKLLPSGFPDRSRAPVVIVAV